MEEENRVPTLRRKKSFVCSECKEEKGNSEFIRNQKRKGVKRRCNSCQLANPSEPPGSKRAARKRAAAAAAAAAEAPQV